MEIRSPSTNKYGSGGEPFGLEDRGELLINNIIDMSSTQRRDLILEFMDNFEREVPGVFNEDIQFEETNGSNAVPDAPTCSQSNARVRCPTVRQTQASFRCPEVECTKVYSSKNGLKYHLQHCHLTPSEVIQLSCKQQTLKYSCHHLLCTKRYKTKSGLKYDLKTFDHINSKTEDGGVRN